MKYKATALLILILCVSGINNATARDNDTGMELLSWIKARDKDYNSLNESFDCGLLYGSINGIRAAGGGVWFKIPLDIQNGQIIEIIKKYLRDNPDKLNQDASFLIINAIAETYPLPANEKPVFTK
jgi:hypothetical protein